MTEPQQSLVVALVVASILVLLLPLLILLVGKLVKKPDKGIKKKIAVSPMVVFSVCVIGAILCLRYAIAYFAVRQAQNVQDTLSWWEEIFNTVAKTLRTISLEEEYADFLTAGKEMVQTVFHANAAWLNVYSIYASALYLSAPIAGGAIVLDILASIFPKIRLFFCNFAFWREKYYFNELSEASLSLARSICENSAALFCKPVIVFTDAYGDEDQCSEWMMEANAIGAICVREALTHIRKNRWGRKKVFLIREDEAANLHMLTELANEPACSGLKNAEVYLFTTGDAYVQVEKGIQDKLVAQNIPEKNLPVFIPVRSYRNLICNMLADVPLFEPLLRKDKNADGSQDLTVTILGSGYIGQEMFLSTYWFGQILHCNLKINVLSLETEDAFWSKIDMVNPEIRHTTIANDPILRINAKGDFSPVYCQVNYRQCDVSTSAFVDCLQEQEDSLLDTDYFFVSLGSDAANISAADMVKRYVGTHHISRGKANRAVIAYVVYDSDLAQILNRKKQFSFVDGSCDVYMHAVGSLEDVYSDRVVFMTDYALLADEAYRNYLSRQSSEERAKIHKKRMQDDYSYWANRARAMHVKYKMFSMGLLTKSVLDYADPKDEAYTSYLKEALQNYKKMLCGEVPFASTQQKDAFVQLLHRMSWLEHRRWCAFTRIKGFRGTTDYTKYAVPGKKGAYKQMELKLHPCLVECDQKGIRGQLNEKFQVDVGTTLQCTDASDFDLLDELTYELHKGGYNNYDFKLYDYPISDF